MQRITFLLVFVLLLVSCVGPADVPTPTLTSSTTALPPTGTFTPSPTATQTRTPTASITPANIEPVELHALALNEWNVGTQMKRLAVFGTGEPEDLAWSPDGNLLAVATTRGVWLYDGTSLEETGFINVNDDVTALAFSSDGMVLALAVKGQVGLWSVPSRQKMRDIPSELVFIYKLAYGRGGQIAALGGFYFSDYSHYDVVLWEVESGNEIYREEDMLYNSEALAFSPDGRLLAFGGLHGVTLVEARTGVVVAENANQPFDLGFNPDGSELFLVSWESGNAVWDYVSDISRPWVDCSFPMAWGKVILVCGVDGTTAVIDLSTGSTLRELDIPPTSFGNTVPLDGGDIAVIDVNGNVVVVNTSTGEVERTIPFDMFQVRYNGWLTIANGMAVLDGATVYLLAVPGQNGDIQIWNLESQQIVRTLETDATITGLGFSPDQHTLASMDTGETLTLWDLESSQSLTSYSITSLHDLRFTRNGLDIILLEDNGDIYTLDLQSSRLLQSGRNTLGSYVFLPDGRFLVMKYHGGTMVFDGSYSLVDPSTNDEYVTLTGFLDSPDFYIPFPFYSGSDGSFFALSSWAGEIKIWNLDEKRLVTTIASGHQTQMLGAVQPSISSLVFSPGSNLLASVGYEETTRLWNVTTGAELRRLNVCCFADFTSDGRYLITAGEGVIRLWGIPSP
jgi:WD40 repeat protein